MIKSIYRNSKIIARFKFRKLSVKPFNIDHFRYMINHLVREIEEDSKYTEIIEKKYIEPDVWFQYLNTFRRNLIKDPFSYIKSDFDQLKHKLDEIDATFYINEYDESNNKVEIAKDSSVQLSNSKDYLFDLIATKAEVDLKEMIDDYKVLTALSDLEKPYDWYPYTRLMKRNIIYHGGPTNSGKTYHALQRLKEADITKGGGLYCGPLRLLALEVYEQLNRQGIYTNLYTGQEKREIPGASHVSSTLEMVSLTKEYDIVVIDEIQMIADKERGYAWTRALLGLKAREIHVCGGLEAEQIVRSLTESTGDNFTLQKYERLSKLVVEEESLRGDYSKVMPGDCIVAFSKLDIFSIRKQIEADTKYKCAIIYGQLPPETRSTQARLFNEEGSGYDILVASDAIGMGLNLNIRRIIFHTTLKGLGKRDSPIDWIERTSIKQIAGRAGRLSSQYKIGLVTCWQEIDLAYVRAVMKWDIPQIQSAGIFPSVDQINSFTEQLDKVQKTKSATEFQNNIDTLSSNKPQVEIATTEVIAKEITQMNDNAKDVDNNQSKQLITNDKMRNSNELSTIPQIENNFITSIRLSLIMSQFWKLSKIDPRFFMCEYGSIRTVANWLHTIPLTIGERYVFANCPMNINDNYSMDVLYHYVSCYSMKKPVSLNVRLSKSLPSNLDSFSELCIKHNIIDLYLWLSLRYPEYFIEKEQCIKQKQFALHQIEKSLSTASSFNASSSHGLSYKSKRDKFGTKLSIIEYGEMIHNDFKMNLEKIPKELYYIV